MVAKGLPDAEQKILADARQYLEEWDKVRKKNLEIRRDNKELAASLDEVEQSIKKVERSIAMVANQYEKMQKQKEYIQSFNDMEDVIDRAAEANKRFNDNPIEIEDHTHLIEEATKAYQDHAGMTDFMREATVRYIKEADRSNDIEQQMVATSKEIKAAREEQLQLTKDLTAAHNDLNTALAAQDAMYSGRRIGDRSRVADAQNMLIGTFGGGGGGGGDGGGGMAAFAGGFFGALKPSTIFGAGLPTAKMVHLIMMATLESLSTIIPAAIAAGSAAAVGLQAGQNLYLRGSAMYNAQEALGAAYGNQTFGTMLGLSRNLQNAQDLAQGGVFGIAGGLRDMVGQGSGAFTNMGVDTIAMINRGVANMVLHDRMTQLAGAVSGGTGFLRSFGDIGANLGDMFLNLAPNLPGMGPLFLNSLKGITGFMNMASGAIPGPLIGGLLAGEAGWRWGDLMLSGGKLPRWLGGGQVGGLSGLAERMGLGTRGIAAADSLTGLAEGGSGLAGFLDVAGGPGTMAAALTAFAMSQLAGTMPTADMRQIAGFQSVIGRSFGAGELTPITNALFKTSQMTRGLAPGGLAASIQQNIPAMETASQIARFGPQAGMGPSAQGVIQNAIGGFASQLGDLVAAGPDAVKALQGIGIKGISLTQAFEAMSMAMIGPKDIVGGKLDATAKQQLKQFMQTYRTATVGGQPGMASGLLMAGAADYIMSSTEMKSLAQVNQGLDAMTQIMTGGPGGQAALFSMLGGAVATRGTRRAGIQLAPAPAMSAMAGALRNVFTPQGAAAWTAFAGPQGMITANQANLDQMRTYLTLGAITGQQGAQLGAFDIQSMLPLAAHSPMAQYMLEQQAMQANIPGIRVGMGYAALVRAITRMAPGARGAMGILTQGTKAVADVPALAASLITGDMGGPSALQSALSGQMAQQALGLAAHPYNVGALRGLMSSMTAGGVGAGQMQVGVDAILKNLHVSPGAISAINSQISGIQASVKLKADEAALKSSISASTRDHQITLKATADVSKAKSDLANIRAHDVKIPTHADTSGAQSAINAVHGKTVQFYSYFHPPHIPTLYGTVIYNAVVRAAGPVAGAIAAGNIGKTSGFQTGGLVPGSGTGDIIPAMLEPGEAIVPRNLVSLIAPILSRYRVPGFGGMPQSSSSHFADGGIVPWGHDFFPGPWKPASDMFPRGDITGRLKGFVFTLIDEITKGLKSASAKKIADALVSQIGKEITYARNVASAAMSGQGFGNSGIFGNMDVTPGSGNGTVAEQMQSYLQTVQSFTKDIGKLRKGHLNKAIIAQLIGAGPVQGDALAQSILNDYGGISGVNKLWSQLGVATKGLGAQAAMSQYGGFIAPNLRSGSFTTNHVTININAKGSGGSLNLTPAQVKQLVATIEAELLKQARRNNKTGLQAQGKGA